MFAQRIMSWCGWVGGVPSMHRVRGIRAGWVLLSGRIWGCGVSPSQQRDRVPGQSHPRLAREVGLDERGPGHRGDHRVVA